MCIRDRVERGILRVLQVLPDESPAVRILFTRYGKRMDYADACLVRLSELHREHTVITTDADDFRIYRRFSRQAIPPVSYTHLDVYKRQAEVSGLNSTTGNALIEVYEVPSTQ